MAEPDTPKTRREWSRGFSLVAGICILLGVSIRVYAMWGDLFWVDEAESCINALTIIDHGVPTSTYQGQPIFENTLLKEAPGDPEYEFYDISYSDRDLAIYHGWLPLYAIATAQAIAGIRPDPVPDTMRPIHSPDDMVYRTVVPRIPSVLFSAVFLIGIYLLLRRAANEPAALLVLIFFCFNKALIRYGVDARYYSLTLCMTVLCAAAAWSLYRHGRWRDYIALGICEGLLFHTHQLSAFVFAVSCALLAPRILKHPQWFGKALTAASIAGLLTIPWAYYTGFFSSAVDLPKAHELFHSYQGWIEYLITRPKPLALVICMVGALFAFALLDHFSFKPFNGLSKRLGIYIFLLIWSLIAYFSFQFLVPAASYFYERLTLIVYVPVIVFIAMTFSEVLVHLRGRWRLGASIALPLVLLVLLNDLPSLYGSIHSAAEKKSEVFDCINEYGDARNVRIYATPNDQLIWSYYTGLPVQSIAPIRRSFLDEYSGQLIFLENNALFTQPDLNAIPSSLNFSEAQNEDSNIRLIQQHKIGAILDQRGLDKWRTNVEKIPPDLQALFQRSLEEERGAQQAHRELLSHNPIFQNLDVDNILDHWMCFYFRFVDYRSRIGENSNIYPLLKKSKTIILPEAQVVAYIYQNP